MNEVIDRLRDWIESGDGDQIEDYVIELIDEFESLQESHNRMTEIYTRRGETIAEMRRLLDQTS